MNPITKVLVALGFFLLFGKKTPDAQHPASMRMKEAATDLETAMSRRPWPKEVAERRARIAFLFGYYESSWYTSPPGYNDAGYACGVMQVHEPEKDIEGATCAKVKSDRVLGWEVGIARIQRYEKECGSIAAALTAFAWDGQCHKGLVLDIVKQRCKKAGLNPETCE